MNYYRQRCLGHYIIDSNTNEAIKINDGSIFKSIITNVTKSINGKLLFILHYIKEKLKNIQLIF